MGIISYYGWVRMHWQGAPRWRIIATMRRLNALVILATISPDPEGLEKEEHGGARPNGRLLQSSQTARSVLVLLVSADKKRFEATGMSHLIISADVTTRTRCRR